MAAVKSAGEVRDVEQQPTSADEFIHYDHIGHGSTPAAWALSITIIIGSVIAGVGFIGLAYSNAWWIAIWIGAAFVPAAIAIGVVMKRMGYGVEMDSNDVLKRGDDPRGHSGPATAHRHTGGEDTSSSAQRRSGAGSH